MEIFARLREATLLARAESELPDFLAERLLMVAASPEQYADASGEVLALLEMLPLYDTYAQTGYMGMGVNNAVLEGAIRRLEGRRR